MRWMCCECEFEQANSEFCYKGAVWVVGGLNASSRVDLMWVWFVFSADWGNAQRSALSTSDMVFNLVSSARSYLHFHSTTFTSSWELYFYNSLVRLLPCDKIWKLHLLRLWHGLACGCCCCCCGFVTCRINLSPFSHYLYTGIAIRSQFQWLEVPIYMGIASLWPAGSMNGVWCFSAWSSVFGCGPKLNRLVDGQVACQLAASILPKFLHI